MRWSSSGCWRVCCSARWCDRKRREAAANLLGRRRGRTRARAPGHGGRRAQRRSSPPTRGGDAQRPGGRRRGATRLLDARTPRPSLAPHAQAERTRVRPQQRADERVPPCWPSTSLGGCSSDCRHPPCRGFPRRFGRTSRWRCISKETRADCRRRSHWWRRAPLDGTKGAVATAIRRLSARAVAMPAVRSPYRRPELRARPGGAATPARRSRPSPPS